MNRAGEVVRVQTVKGNHVNHLADDIETPRAFERMLRDAGFSRSRAKAITAKGFKLERYSDNDVIAEIVGLLQTKRDQLVLETKQFGKLEFVAGPTWNDKWRVLGVISPSSPSSFKISARTLNHYRLMPVELSAGV